MTRDQPLLDSVPFFNWNVRRGNPFQIPCVFSSKTRLAWNVIVNLYDSRPTAPTFFVFSKKTRVAGIPPHSSGSLSLCFLRCNVSWVHKSVWIHMWCCQPLPDLVSLPKGKRASEESPGSFKAGRKTYVDQGVFSCVCRKEKKWRCGKHLSKGSPSTEKKTTSKRRFVETAGSEQTYQYSCCGQNTCLHM